MHPSQERQIEVSKRASKERKPIRLSWSEFLELWHPNIHEDLGRLRRSDGTDGIVSLECHVLDSSLCGSLTGFVYGPERTYKTLDEMTSRPGGVYPTGLPSSASFPIAYTEDTPSEPEIEPWASRSTTP